MYFVVLIITAYLLGSIPFGLIIARAHGKDLRKIGSGNIGATNLARALGRKWGWLCFCLDMLKGLLPTVTAVSIWSTPPTTGQLFLTLLTGCSAVIGHILPVYVRFHGGKGVATSFGVALGLWPYYTTAAAVAFAVWIACLLIWRYVSLASVAAAAVFGPALAAAIALNPNWYFSNLWPLLTAAVAIPVVVVIRHRENLRRLLRGDESKILLKKPALQNTQ